MNCRFILCVLAATFVCLHAVPRLARSDLPGNVGSVIQWSDCSEFVLLIKFLFYLFIFLNLASGWLL